MQVIVWGDGDKSGWISIEAISIIARGAGVVRPMDLFTRPTPPKKAVQYEFSVHWGLRQKPPWE
jgi:hypothetical protein